MQPHEEAEWRFNDYSDQYDKFPLKNVTSEQYEEWLYSFADNFVIKLKIVPIECPNKAEKRYEVIQAVNDLVHIRIKTIQAGQNLSVYARGAKWIYDDEGKSVTLRYLLSYKGFYLDMVEDWNLENTPDFIAEFKAYPADNKLRLTGSARFCPMPKIYYQEIKNKEITKTYQTEQPPDPGNKKGYKDLDRLWSAYQIDLAVKASGGEKTRRDMLEGSRFKVEDTLGRAIRDFYRLPPDKQIEVLKYGEMEELRRNKKNEKNEKGSYNSFT